MGTDTQDEGVEQASPEDSSSEVMRLRAQGVPLALIADLVNPGGPDSPEILAEEGLPDVGWLGDGAREPSDDEYEGDEDDVSSEGS